jgi:hypothetical protein
MFYTRVVLPLMMSSLPMFTVVHPILFAPIKMAFKFSVNCHGLLGRAVNFRSSTKVVSGGGGKGASAHRKRTTKTEHDQWHYMSGSPVQYMQVFGRV